MQTSVSRRTAAVHIVQRSAAAGAARLLAGLSLVLALGACASDMADNASLGSGASAASAARATPARPAPAMAVSATAPDGYPNVSVDTAGSTRTRPRDSVDQQRLEQDLLALGARTRVLGSRDRPDLAVDELKALATRNKAAVDADRSVSEQPPQ